MNKRCGHGNHWNENNNWQYGGSGSSPISTATLMKTGQTTSYRTGDDGDLEKGRSSSFTVLAENNPFSNTNRFTALDGTQTYANNIVVDWSTFNGTTVLGWYKVKITATWNNAVDNSLAASYGGYTSGWRLPNLREMFSLANYQNTITLAFNYAPFSFTTPNFWTSTTCASNTTLAYYLPASTSIPVYTNAKAGSLPYLSCRTFTVSGTTLT